MARSVLDENRGLPLVQQRHQHATSTPPTRCQGTPAAACTHSHDTVAVDTAAQGRACSATRLPPRLLVGSRLHIPDPRSRLIDHALCDSTRCGLTECETEGRREERSSFVEVIEEKRRRRSWTSRAVACIVRLRLCRVYECLRVQSMRPR